MNYNNISTNILRDQTKEIDYLPTANSKEIFDRIFLHNYGANKSFNLIGNYGTGKSTFLWALEKNLSSEVSFFTNYKNINNGHGFRFIKIVGENISFHKALAKALLLNDNCTSDDIINSLDKYRALSQKKAIGLVIIIDEFGKFLEFASKNKSIGDLYLLQQISEWVNNDDYQTYFIVALHQNFLNYGKNLTSQDKLEWEKVKGRFVDLVFNEPVEQLLFFAGKKLNSFELPKKLENRHSRLINLVKESNLINLKADVESSLSRSIFPLDWLSANVLVYSLQRYGQNERSLFSFLNDKSEHSIQNNTSSFYDVPCVYNYIVSNLSSEINSPENSHRAQWLTTFRALERAELIFEHDYQQASDVIKTIGLVNLFSKVGGLFDANFLVNYFKLTRSSDVKNIIQKLEKAGITRFYKHSNKINFLEGTDLDLEQELLLVTKDINESFSVASEILNRIDFPVLLAKKYSFLTGTNRFFEVRIIESVNDIHTAERAIDGYVNLIFGSINTAELLSVSEKFIDNLFVVYNNFELIRQEVIIILKFEILLTKHQMDANALKLLNNERIYHVNRLNNLVYDHLFTGVENLWVHNAATFTVSNKKQLYTRLTDICLQIYTETPIFNSELINREYISSPINAARKQLLRKILANEEVKELGFNTANFPPEKAIYISLLRESGIHQKNKIGYYKLQAPPEDSNLFDLWNKSEQYLNSTISNKRNLREFIDELLKAPYKLKKGFVDFWIPVFLLAKKEDYALFYSDGGFIPFITEDTLDLIHKKPQDFLIKSYDVSGLNLNLLESYKELVQINDVDQGIQSTFLSIYGNFLRFQRGLNKYSLNTKKLSPKAIRLRDSIINSKDPEDALFNQFPQAIGFKSFAIKEDEEILDSFTFQIQDAIREIRTAFDELLNRIENAIINSFYCESVQFTNYKTEIKSKIEGLNAGILSSTQTIFFKRLLSPLDDRNSWLKSVADVALGRGIDEMIDEEEILLFSNIKDLSLGLIKAAEIHKFNSGSTKGKLYLLRFFGESGEFVDNKLVLQKERTKEYDDLKNNISNTIGKLDVEKRKELLIELLTNEMSI